jgi:hypothetical protein
MNKPFVFKVILSFLFIHCLIHRSEAIVDISSCLAQNWIQCGLTIGSLYFSLHRWNDYTITDFDVGDAQKYTCNGQVKGGFYRWQWKYQATFSCPTFSPSIQGTSNNYKSSQGSIEHAIQDWFTKVGQVGLLTSNRVKALANLGFDSLLFFIVIIFLLSAFIFLDSATTTTTTKKITTRQTDSCICKNYSCVCP